MLNTEREDRLAEKVHLRALIKQKLSLLSATRKTEASEKLLTLNLDFYQNVLSFVSFDFEINTQKFNQLLSTQKRLLLPKMAGNELHIYRVTDLETELIKHPYGLLEPNPDLCEQVTLNPSDLCLVPGLAFDTAHNRLGRGKGFYDRFLKTVPCRTVGVGYQEQLLNSLPVESHESRPDALFLL